MKKLVCVDTIESEGKCGATPIFRFGRLWQIPKKEFSEAERWRIAWEASFFVDKRPDLVSCKLHSKRARQHDLPTRRSWCRGLHLWLNYTGPSSYQRETERDSGGAESSINILCLHSLRSTRLVHAYWRYLHGYWTVGKTCGRATGMVLLYSPREPSLTLQAVPLGFHCTIRCACQIWCRGGSNINIRARRQLCNRLHAVKRSERSLWIKPLLTVIKGDSSFYAIAEFKGSSSTTPLVI